MPDIKFKLALKKITIVDSPGLNPLTLRVSFVSVYIS